MKNRTFVTSALLALGLASQSNAANVVNLTGSTAFRANAFAAIVSQFDSTPQIATRGNSKVTSATWMLFHGNVGGVETYVNCVWSGSEAGIASTAGVSVDDNGQALSQNPPFYLKADGSVAYTTNSANPTAGETNTFSTLPDLTFADTSQAVSLTQTPALVPMGPAGLQGTVGIVTFTWVKNTNSTPITAWTNLKNVTRDQLNVEIAAPQRAGFFTGKASDTNVFVYLVGRNKGSGTRVNMLADTGYGVTVPVTQFSIGGTPFVGGLNLALEYGSGDGGYESGGDVAKALSVDGSAQQTDPFFGGTGWIAIGYLGVNDALGASLGPTYNWLTLSGVAESDGAIEEGTYSYWGHEHLYGKVGISGAPATFGNSLASGIPAQLGGSNPSANSGGIALQYMHADKSSDLAPPTRNF